ncbi:unnamed protein product [Aspergillus oryzae var. brunneus]|uniref:Unnamed protein product n=1 Tax=Aspergillus oryzae var. brunneus TaxID=332754 RepID=A0ABQ6LB45_ASPOZ|nr:unnamed protein product [Aspergillus oryzae var. brunneus]
MAGPVRQPIDVVALENYIGQYDLGISPPLNLKQVTSLPPKLFHTSIPEGTQEIKSSSPPLRTLVKLHTLDYNTVGLGGLGKHNKFYDRQIRTFTEIAQRQSRAVNANTNVPLGELPHLVEIASFFKTNQPKDRSGIVHGDFKIDNIVFHKTEPKVIGVLDWEMATIGHPLSDVVHLLSPIFQESGPAAPVLRDGGRHSIPGLPGLEESLRWYNESGYEARPDLDWGIAFAHFRGCVIAHGIAARYVTGQSKSPGAKEWADSLDSRAQIMWETVKKLRESYIREKKL